MKTVKTILTIAFLSVVLFNVNAGKKPVALGVDVAKSSVNWLAKKVTGQHNGTINITKGSLDVDGKKIVGGSFEIDMKSMKCLDITDAGYNGKLMGHLAGADFFDTGKFGTATLKITKVTPKDGKNVEITGDLTIKGITAPITFPASVEMSATGVSATAEINVDRTKYDIKYGSKSFFASIGDKAIDDTFKLDIKLVAGK
jgi:polyisoprenoid-binding protein YceI